MTGPRVAVVTTGGTIQAVGQTPADLTEYMNTGITISADELLRSLDLGPSTGDIRLHPFGQIPSPSINDAHWIELLGKLDGLAEHHDGIVVTHGTNTLEETALFLALTWAHPVPVVLTGAMRPSSAHGPDGPGNLIDAIRVASAETARDRGVQVAFAGRVFDPGHVTKARSDVVDAFDGGEAGCTGVIEADGSVTFFTPARRRSVLHLAAGLDALARVDVIVSHANADGVAIQAFVSAGAQGLILAGTGAGHPTSLQRTHLDDARESGVALCRASRSASGVAIEQSSFPGWLAAGRLRPWQARIVLSLALTAGLDRAATQNLLDDVQSASSPLTGESPTDAP